MACGHREFKCLIIVNGGRKMIYICRECKFLFESNEEVDRCPDCGKMAVQEADEKEKTEYYERKRHPECWDEN